MKTKTSFLALLLAVASLLPALAQTNSATGNVVGYYNEILYGNRYTAVANPFNAPTNTFPSLFKDLPSSAQILKFNHDLGDFDIYNRISFGAGWSPPAGATATLRPGEGCFILVSGPDLTNCFVGEVLQGNLTNAVLPGYNLIGNMVPDSGPVAALQLTNLPASLQLLKWNVALQDYDIYTRITFGAGWSPQAPSLSVGESFFMYTGSAFNWVRDFSVP